MFDDFKLFSDGSDAFRMVLRAPSAPLQAMERKMLWLVRGVYSNAEKLGLKEVVWPFSGLKQLLSSSQKAPNRLLTGIFI